jgi:DNA helicase II / ATP-dependent DNA helicase PcrA
MDKDYKNWSKVKRRVNNGKLPENFEIKSGDIFWCFFGENVGIEIDGKGEDYVRPALVIKFFNPKHIWVVPLTTNQGNIKFNIRLDSFSEFSYAITSQLKTISTLRLLRFIKNINRSDFLKVIHKTIDHLKYETLIISDEGISPPFGTNDNSLSKNTSLSIRIEEDKIKIMNTQEFDAIYKSLNKAQKKAVDTIEGPVMVVAGPGTGKTTVLTLRIANILQKTDTSPDNILALTFTESGAYNMRKKLVSIIGTPGYRVSINTFHGFCNDIIKQYPEKFPRIIGSTAIIDIDQIALMEKIIDKTDLEYLKPYGDVYFYVKPVLNEIRNLKREAIDPKEFEKVIKKQEKDFKEIPDKVHEKGAHKGKMKGEYIKLLEKIEKNRELLKLYTDYEKALEENKYYDFEDMIMEVIKALRTDENLLLILQETYQYILADEHQDANNAQNTILELLSSFHENPNLFIVGDEKQAIFRFQGASLENFLYFKKIYPDAVLINLEENYRSTQPILDASHSLIQYNKTAKENVLTTLKSQKKEKDLIKVVECLNEDSELLYITNDIEKKIKEGVNPDEIAILYRENRDAFSIAYALKKLGFTYRIESDNDILKDENIVKLLLIFECVNDLSDEEKMAKVLFIDFLKLDTLEVYKILKIREKDKVPLIDLVVGHFPNLAKKLSSWASISFNKTFVELFEIIIRESGYLEMALQSKESIEIMSVLETFFNQIKSLASTKKEYNLKDFVGHLVRVREHGILSKNSSSLFKTGIRLMTAHKSKGLEFDYVYIVGAYEGHWGGKYRRSLFSTMPAFSGDIDDERRLFYVALTRARKEVTITYPKEGVDGRELLPAQFVTEIDSKHINKEVFTQIPKTELKFRDFKHDDHKEIKNKSYLQELFLEQGLSVTALNNYLKCPWDYFFINLIRIPRNQTKHQIYGTSIHETLRTFFNKYRDEEDMSLDDLLAVFNFNLNKSLLSPEDFKDTLEKGRESLTKYFNLYNGKWNRNLLTEYSIRGVHLNVGKFDLVLKGDLDKIEFLNEDEVNVVDYKTGKKNYENKEKYHRQLVFYKLLLDKEEKKKYIMKTGELDFVELGKKDKFEITEKEIEELKALIKEKALEIYNLEFFGKICDEKNCEYCNLGKIFSK